MYIGIAQGKDVFSRAVFVDQLIKYGKPGDKIALPCKLLPTGFAEGCYLGNLYPARYFLPPRDSVICSSSHSVLSFRSLLITGKVYQIRTLLSNCEWK
jgi:hypothetical protein